MSDDINVHKISDQHKRRAEHIKDKPEKQGMGQDHAEKVATEQAVEELGDSAGGPNSAGDSPRHANYEGNNRNGSEKQSHSG